VLDWACAIGRQVDVDRSQSSDVSQVRLCWNRFLAGFVCYVLRKVRVGHFDAGMGKRESVCPPAARAVQKCDTAHGLIESATQVVVSADARVRDICPKVISSRSTETRHRRSLYRAMAAGIRSAHNGVIVLRVGD
jgi:hypothetical protein